MKFCGVAFLKMRSSSMIAMFPYSCWPHPPRTGRLQKDPPLHSPLLTALWGFRRGGFCHSMVMLRKDKGNLTDNMRRDLSAMANRGHTAFDEIDDLCNIISFEKRRHAKTRQAKI